MEPCVPPKLFWKIDQKAAKMGQYDDCVATKGLKAANVLSYDMSTILHLSHVDLQTVNDFISQLGGVGQESPNHEVI
jgi:hypothetical protein